MRVDWRQVVPALLLGCLLGLWGGHWLSRAAYGRMLRQGSDTQRLLNKFSSELKLDAGQQEAVKAVLESYRAQMKALHEGHAKRFGEIRASMHGDVAKLLNPEQLKRFQDMQARWDARRKNWK